MIDNIILLYVDSSFEINKNVCVYGYIVPYFEQRISIQILHLFVQVSMRKKNYCFPLKLNKQLKN